MKILCIDQATHGGYSIWDYKKKKLLSYSGFDCVSGNYNKVIEDVVNLARQLIKDNNIEYVVFEDIQFQRNVQTLIKLARLQGGLIYMLEDNGIQFSIVPPKTWQAFIKKQDEIDSDKIMRSKDLSFNFLKEKYNLEINNDNICDAICIGYYVVNNIDIE